MHTMYERIILSTRNRVLASAWRMIALLRALKPRLPRTIFDHSMWNLAAGLIVVLRKISQILDSYRITCLATLTFTILS